MTGDIHDAAAALYAEVGAEFTLDMLAMRTGLSRATLYRRIGNKGSLMAALAAKGLIRPRESTEQRVLDAARRVVGQYGFLACTMDEIAREAGIGVATLYRRFGSKRRLLLRLSDEPAPRPVVRQTASAGDNGGESALRQMVEVGLRFAVHNREAVRAILSASEAEEPFVQAQRRASAEAFDRMVTYLRAQQRGGVLRDDQPAEDLAMVLNGLIMQYALFGPAYLDRSLEIEADAGVIMALFLKAAGHAT